MVWGEGVGDEYPSEDIDAPYINPCLYDLNYFINEQRLSGEAKMADSPTISQFIAYKT